jgi:uncharacterized protein
MSRIITLTELAGDYAVSQLNRTAPIPAWADGDGFVSIGRTADELSVVCLAERVPAGIRTDGPWSAFKFEGPFDFAETGIAAAVIGPLAEAKIGVFLVSTFDTDYLLVKRAARDVALSALRQVGHAVQVVPQAQ